MGKKKAPKPGPSDTREDEEYGSFGYETDNTDRESLRIPDRSESRMSFSESGEPMVPLKENMELVRQLTANTNAIMEKDRRIIELIKTVGELKKQIKDMTDMNAAKRKKTDMTSSDEDRAAKKPANIDVDMNRQVSMDTDMTATATDTQSRQTDKSRQDNAIRTQDKPTSKGTKIPPIVIHDSTTWKQTATKLTHQNIKFKTGKLTRHGVSVTPETADDHRQMTKTLRQDKQEYHTYTLSEEKTGRVVIRGLPPSLTNDDIKDSLLEQGHNATSVNRMTSHRTKQTLPLVLVRLPEENTEDLLKIRTCCRLIVRAEPQKKKTDPGQCHRCQRFGHAQPNLSA